MAKALHDWLESDVAAVKDKSVRWLSEQYFFRDPLRPNYSDLSYFFAPADGILLYQQVVEPHDALVEIKGKSYSLREAMRDSTYNRRSMVLGIFMTFFDVHINRVPYPGRLSYKQLEPIDSLNYPMLTVEKNLLQKLQINMTEADYLHNNQRMLNRIYAPQLQQWYYLLQIADYDVDSITPFELKQNRHAAQNQRFSQIRYGSQVDLIVPLSQRFDFRFVQQTGSHVEAGIDPVIEVIERND